MPFKLVRSAKPLSLLTNQVFLSSLLENHKEVLNRRGSESLARRNNSDNDSIPPQEKESKFIFDFFYDEKIEAAKQSVLSDLEDRTISSSVEPIIDRRRTKKK